MLRAKPKYYDAIYLVVVTLNIGAITWLCRSGALQLFDRHPRANENYELSWFVSLLISLPSGFMMGSFLMFYYLMWFQKQSTNRDDR